MNKYSHHKYTYQPRFGWHKHSWTLIGEHGGLEFHISLHDDHKHTECAGLEIHSRTGQGAPDHCPCWLTGAPCWHDGTSMYATDHLWPEIKAYLKGGEHGLIFKVLEREADERWTREEAQ